MFFSRLTPSLTDSEELSYRSFTDRIKGHRNGNDRKLQSMLPTGDLTSTSLSSPAVAWRSAQPIANPRPRAPRIAGTGFSRKKSWVRWRAWAKRSRPSAQTSPEEFAGPDGEPNLLSTSDTVP